MIMSWNAVLNKLGGYYFKFQEITSFVNFCLLVLFVLFSFLNSSFMNPFEFLMAFYGCILIFLD